MASLKGGRLSSAKGEERASKVFPANCQLCHHCNGDGVCRQLNYRRDPGNVESCRDCKEAVGGNWQRIRMASCNCCEGLGYLTLERIEELYPFLFATNKDADLASAS